MISGNFGHLKKELEKIRPNTSSKKETNPILNVHLPIGGDKP